MILGPVMRESAYFISKGKMTRSEYENKIKELGIDLQELNIVIGRKTNVPISTGCYFEDGNWILYNVDERQNFPIIKRVMRIEFSNLYI